MIKEDWMNWYRCDVCGCYLDPGEGSLCDECREKKDREPKRHTDDFIKEEMDEHGAYACSSYTGVC